MSDLDRVGGSTLKYRPDIDGLRGVAVGLVVAYHAFPQLKTGGFVGVDVFFVISGYLITQLILAGLSAGTFSVSEFYRRRVRRILPALLVVMMATCILGWLLQLPSEFSWLGQSIKWCAPFLANFYFATMGGYFARAAVLNPLLHLWSLGVEEQFYLAWPVLLILAARQGVTLRALAAIIAASLSFSVWSAWHGSSHFYNPATRAWELAVGAILAAWQLRSARRPRSPVSPGGLLRSYGTQAISLAGLALIVAGGACWTPDKPIPGIWSAIPVGGAALLIGAGPSPMVNRWILGNRPMIFLGRISYPLYLWHWPLFSFTRIVLGAPPQPAIAASEIVIAFAAAYLTYRWVEAPIRYTDLGRKAVPGLLAGLAALALAGAAANARLIPPRLSGPTVAAWDKAVTDWHYPEESLDRRSRFKTLQVPSHRELKVLFVGDSHIQQYWPRAAYLTETEPDLARSARFVTLSACPPLPGINSLRRQNCALLFDYAMGEALRPDVDTVVFGAFWEDYLIGEYAVASSSRPRIYRVADDTRTPLELDSPGTGIAFEEFEQRVSKLVSSGRRVFIVLSNPTSPLFIPVFPSEIRLSLRVPQYFPLGGGPRVDAESFESFVSPLMGRLRGIAARTGAKVVDPRLSLCDGLICPARGADGLPLYLDSNHLRGSAARERATFVDEMLLGLNASYLQPAAAAGPSGERY